MIKVNFNNIKERYKYSIFTNEGYRIRDTCPFCQEYEYNDDIEYSCSRNLKTLTNNINGKSICMSNMELHIIIYHNFISERVFSILFDVSFALSHASCSPCVIRRC